MKMMISSNASDQGDGAPVTGPVVGHPTVWTQQLLDRLALVTAYFVTIMTVSCALLAV